MGSVRWPLVIRMLAGAYLIYLGITLIDGIQKGDVTGGMTAIVVIGIAAFFVFAAWAFISSIRTIIRDQKNAENEEEERIREEEEEKKRIMAAAERDQSNSFFAKMNRFSNAQAAEDEEPEEEPDEEDPDDGETDEEPEEE